MHKNKYKAKTLIGNWAEERALPEFDEVNVQTGNTFLANPSYQKYIPISKDVGNKIDYSQQKFEVPAYEYKPEETFKTTHQQDIPKIEHREDKFKLMQTSLTKNEDALQQYRDRWTTGNHNFDRTYLGSQK